MTEDVLFSEEGQLGIITLNRTSALNALTLSMILAIQRQLSLWKYDERIAAIIIRANSGSAFCAGGDVRALYYSGRLNDIEQMQFFAHEYRLNRFIYQLGKPYIALMDGIVMGGGVGISLHGSHPVATENFVFSMPETSIGFFPDIGASFLLNRCPGHLGAYLGLTGNRLGPEDAYKARLIKTIVSQNDLPQIIKTLQEADLSKNAYEVVSQCLEEFTHITEAEASQIKPAIDACFGYSSIEQIRLALQNQEGVWPVSIDTTLSQKSPLSLKVTLAQLQKAKECSLEECLQMDYNLACHFMHGHDFYEGVRAMLIDKDKTPLWNPASLDLVTDGLVENYFSQQHEKLEWL